MPTLHDLARAAGVSKSTVARALNAEAGVSAAAREAVLAAAARLHYRPHQAARDLRSGRGKVLGVVVPDPASGDRPLSSALQARKLEGLATACQRHDLGLQVFIQDLQQVSGLQAIAFGRDLAGLCFLGQIPDTVCAQLQTWGIPWVGLNWRHAQRRDRCVWTDFHHAGATLVEHLAAAGCSRILACDWLSFDYGPFDQGLRSAAQRAGVQLDLRQERKLVQPAATAALVAGLDLRQLPQGICFGSERAAAAGLRALHQRGLRVGRDCLVACFDDSGIPECCDPPLSAYEQPAVAIGEAAVEQLVALLEGKRPPRLLELPGTLHPRASSAWTEA